jgi:hypothetical protein
MSNPGKKNAHPMRFMHEDADAERGVHTDGPIGIYGRAGDRGKQQFEPRDCIAGELDRRTIRLS